MNTQRLTPVRVNGPAIVVGAFLILSSLFGLWYNAMVALATLDGAFADLQKQLDVPYFYPAYYTMSGICITCYCVLLVCGVGLVMSHLRWSRLATLVLLFEVAYFFAVGSLWHERTIGRSVGAATGVANGGMMVQFIVLLPLWGPLLLWWAKHRQAAVAVTVPDATGNVGGE